MAVVKIRSGFGQLLRDALDDQEPPVSLRELARRLAERDGKATPESKRRLLHRYIDGVVAPSKHARHEIALVLGLKEDTFDESAEELAEMQALVAALEPLAAVLHRLAVQARDRGKKT